MYLLQFLHMREGMGRSLREYNALAKRMQAGEALTQREKQSALQEGAKRADTSEEVQRDIAALQSRKQRRMQGLRQELRAVDMPEIEQSREPRVMERDGVYIVRDYKGKEWAITYGQLLTDIVWGRRYRLDHSVNRGVKKAYALAKAKHDLADMLDDQILKEETNRVHIDDMKRDTYLTIQEQKKSLDRRSGILAERMVSSFLQQIALDFPVGFAIEPTDVHEDVELKIDFKIVRKNHIRGVGVTASDHEQTIGIQFTSTDSQEILSKKRQQIARAQRAVAREHRHIRDVVLVSVPLYDIQRVYTQWERAGSPPGGPHALWDEQMKERLFKAVLKGIFSPQEIDARWDMVAQREHHTATQQMAA